MAGCGKSVSSGTSKLKLSFRALKLRLDYELRHMYTGLRSSLDHVDVFDVRRNVDAAAFSSLAFIRNVAFCSRRRINTLVSSTLAATQPPRRAAAGIVTRRNALSGILEAVATSCIPSLEGTGKVPEVQCRRLSLYERSSERMYEEK